MTPDHAYGNSAITVSVDTAPIGLPEPFHRALRDAEEAPWKWYPLAQWLAMGRAGWKIIADMDGSEAADRAHGMLASAMFRGLVDHAMEMAIREIKEAKSNRSGADMDETTRNFEMEALIQRQQSLAEMDLTSAIPDISALLAPPMTLSGIIVVVDGVQKITESILYHRAAAHAWHAIEAPLRRVANIQTRQYRAMRRREMEDLGAATSAWYRNDAAAWQSAWHTWSDRARRSKRPHAEQITHQWRRWGAGGATAPDDKLLSFYWTMLKRVMWNANPPSGFESWLPIMRQSLSLSDWMGCLFAAPQPVSRAMLVQTPTDQMDRPEVAMLWCDVITRVASTGDAGQKAVMGEWIQQNQSAWHQVFCTAITKKPEYKYSRSPLQDAILMWPSVMLEWCPDWLIIPELAWSNSLNDRVYGARTRFAEWWSNMPATAWARLLGNNQVIERIATMVGDVMRADAIAAAAQDAELAMLPVAVLARGAALLDHPALRPHLPGAAAHLISMNRRQALTRPRPSVP